MVIKYFEYMQVKGVKIKGSLVFKLVLLMLLVLANSNVKATRNSEGTKTKVKSSFNYKNFLSFDPCNINPVATSNSPAYVGSNVQLSTNTIGDSYLWTGPDGFASTLQNPVITNITLAQLGVYTLAVTKDGCTATATTTVSTFPITITSTKIDNVNICGADGRIVVTVENDQTLNTNNAIYSLSNIEISTDILFNEAIKTGVDFSSIVAVAIIHPLVGSETTLPISSTTLTNGIFTFTFSQQVVLKKCDYIQIVFSFKENCNVLNSPISSLDNARNISSSVNLTLTNGASNFTGTITETGVTTYNLIYPKFKLDISAATKNIEATMGDHLTRSLTISNTTGAGSVSNFTIKVNYANTAITQPAATLKLVKLNNTVTLNAVINGGVYSYNVTTLDLQNLGLGATFDDVESFFIEENSDVIACVDANSELSKAEFSIEWGCADATRPICNVGDGSATQTAFLIKKGIYPALNTVVSNNVAGNLCSTTNPGPTVWVEIKNNGLATKDKAVHVAPILTWTGINVSSVSIVNKNNGQKTAISPLPVSGVKFNINANADVDGIGGLSDIDGDTYFNDLAKGETLTLEVEYTVPACANSCSGSLRNIKASSEYYAVCESSPSHTNESKLEDEEKIITDPVTNGPSDMLMGGSAKTFSFFPRVSTTYGFVPNQYTSQVTVQLPTGYVLDGLTGNATFTSINGGAPVALEVTQVGQLVTLTNGNIDGNYSIDIKLVCDPAVTTFGFDDLNWSLMLNTTGGCVCNRTIACTSHEIYRHLIDCSGGNPGGGFDHSTCNTTVIATLDNTAFTTAFDANRTTFGYVQTFPNNTSGIWTDTDINNNPVAANANTPGVELKAAYACDGINVVVTGKTTDACFPTYLSNNIHVRVTQRADASGNPMFTLKPASSSFVIGNTTVAANDPAPVYDAATNVWVFDFVFAPSPTFVVNNDNLQLTTNFTVNKNNTLPSNLYVKRFRGTVYAGNTYSGYESFGNAFHLYTPKLDITEKPLSSNSNFLCDAKRILNFNITGGSSGDDFPNEFRSIAHENSITYQLPPNFNYVAGSSVISVSGATNNLTFQPADAVISGDLTTGLFLEWTRNAGNKSWPLLDKQGYSTDVALSFEVVPACNALPGGSFNATVNHTNYDHSTACVEPANIANVSGSNGFYYPNFDIATQEQVSAENFVELPFILRNVGNTSPNTWIAFEPPANAKIDAVYEVINGVDNLVSNPVPYGVGNNSVWIKLGTVTSGAINYKVKTSFTSCDESVADAVNVFAGWNCSGYPASPPNFTPNSSFSAATATTCGTLFTGQLVYTHKKSLLYLSEINFDPITKGICDATTFTVNLICQDQSSLADIKGLLNLPVGVTLNSVKGKFMAYPAATIPPAFSNLAYTAPVLADQPYTIDVTSVLPTNRGEVNLKFNEYVSLEVAVQPSCNYPVKQPITLDAIATTSCAQSITTSPVAKRIPILGFEAIEDIQTQITTGTVQDISMAPVAASITVDNNSTFANTGEVVIVAKFPNTLIYNAPVSGIVPASIENTTNGQVVTWIYPVNALLASSSNQINFTVQQTALCTSVLSDCCLPIDVTTSVRKELQCSTQSTSCIVDVELSKASTPFCLFGCYTNVVVNSPNSCYDELVTLTASGAASYTWEPTNEVTPTSQSGNTATVHPLITSSYVVTGTEANGCSATATAVVTILSIDDYQVCGSRIGCVNKDVYLQNGTPGASQSAEYSWDYGDGSPINTAPYHAYATAGNYVVTLLTGSAACAVNAVKTNVYITDNCADPCQVLPTVSVSANSQSICASQSTVLTASGTDTYEWSPAYGLNTTTGASVVATPSVTTTYVVTGTNVFGCFNTQSITISVANCCPTLAVNSPTICLGTNGNLTASGANAYQWSTGETTASIVVAPTVNTSYTVTGINAGCTVQLVAMVTVNTSTIVCGPVTPTVTTNCIDNPMSVSVLVTGYDATPSVLGGSTPYTYLWEKVGGGAMTAPTDANQTNLDAGTYKVIVTSSVLTCTATATVTLPECGFTNVSIVAEKNPTCNKTCDGVASISLTEVDGVSFVWDDGKSTASYLSGACAGNHKVVITSKEGCSIERTIALNAGPCDEPPPPTCDLTLTNHEQKDKVCFSDNGFVNIYVTGGLAPFIHYWQTPTENYYSSNEDLENPLPGHYILTTTDARGCVKTIAIDVYGPVSTLTPSIVTSQPACVGGTGSFTTTITGGKTPYTINWADGSSNLIRSNLVAGSYTATITDFAGCTTGIAASIKTPVINTKMFASQKSICDGEEATLTARLISGYTYEWSSLSTNGTAQTIGNGRSITTHTPGTYTLTYNSSVEGCTNFTDDFVLVHKDSCRKTKETCHPGEIVELVDDTVSDCISQQLYSAESYGVHLHTEYMEEQKRIFKQSYRETVMNSLQETFTLEYDEKEYQYTLYYYDQAGNLVKTVMPSGVKPLIPSVTDVAKDEMAANTANPTVYTDHTMATTYKYNSLNQLITQDMPDHNRRTEWTVSPASITLAGATPAAVAYTSETNGLMIANTSDHAVLYNTVDAGASWNIIPNPGVSRLLDIQKIDANNVYAVGVAGTCIKSINGGVDWKIIAPPVSEDILRVYFTGAFTGKILTRSGKFYATTDGGAHWMDESFALINAPMVGTITDASLKAGSFYVTTFDGTIPHIYIGTNNGDNWTEEPYTAGNINAVVKNGTGYLGVGVETALFTQDASIGNTGFSIARSNNAKPFSQITSTNGFNAVTTTGELYTATGTLTGATNTLNWSAATTTPPSVTIKNLISVAGKDVALTTDDKIAESPTWSFASPTQLGSNTIVNMRNLNDVLAIVTTNNTVLVKGIGSDLGDPSGWTQVPVTGADITSGAKVKDIWHDAATPTNNWVVLLDNGSIYPVTLTNVLGNDEFTLGTAIPSTGLVQRFVNNSNTELYAINNNQILRTTDALTFASPINLPGALTQTTLNSIAISGQTVGSNTTVSAMAIFNNGSNYEYTTANGWIPRKLNPSAQRAIADNGTNTYTAGDNGEIYKRQSNKWVYQPHTTPDINISEANIAANNTLRVASQNNIYVYAPSSVTGGTLVSEIGSPLSGNITRMDNDANRIVAVTDDGSVNSTTGGSWNLNYPSGVPLYAIDAVSGGMDVAGGNNGSAFYFNASWQAANTPLLQPLHKLVTDGINAIAVGDEGTIITSGNAGTNWQLRNPGGNSVGNLQVAAMRGTNAVAADASGYICVSANTGQTWTAFQQTPTAIINAVAMSNTKVLAVSGNKVYIANAGATNFTPYLTLTSGTQINDITLDADGYGFLVGDNGLAYRITPTGYTKINTDADIVTNEQGSGLSPFNSFKAVTATDRLTAYITQTDGIVLKTSDGGLHWKIQEQGLGTASPLLAMGSINNGTLVDGNIVNKVSDYMMNYSSSFWYDELGRLVLSQNSKQYNIEKYLTTTPALSGTGLIRAYSYTLYDDIGRITQVGELLTRTPVTTYKHETQVQFSQVPAFLATGVKREITKTYYDRVLPQFTNLQAGFTQENLRPRVASVTYQDVDGLAYDRATHYSYDIHGNVKNLIQEITANGTTLKKRLDYEYDLVSGKVNRFYYQKDQADQLIHKYEYDGDNRIVQVYTSRDNVIWDRDAKYDYAGNGSLTRSTIGQNNVEENNYAYTIQGWIKGVNGNQFSYALGYYNGDYSSVGIPNTTNLATPIVTGKGLFNANIATMASNTPQLANQAGATFIQQFEYDQLNRLLGSTNVGAAAPNSFKTAYAYDAGGNITNLKRFDIAGAQYDNMQYTYQNTQSDYANNTNKLRGVDDDLAFTNINTTDINDQNVDNYQYDDIGNLIYDKQEEIDNIEWTVYGKISKITRTATSPKADLEFAYDAGGNRIAKIVKEKGGNVITTFYLLDPQGNVLSTYTKDNTVPLTLEEQYIYGSSRLGVLKPTFSLTDNLHVTGQKDYEFTDHLGSVRLTLNDKGIVTSAVDYLPFGSIARSFNLSALSFGFHGMEGDEEISGENNSYTTKFRQYDPRLGRWFSVDPLMILNYTQSPFVGIDNSPIALKDISGMSTDVIKQKDGTYKVTGGNLEDDDKGIYVVDKDGARTGEKLGESLTIFSFFNEDKQDGNGQTGWMGTIDINSTESGDLINSFTKDVDEDKIGLIEYMKNATDGKKYDFKRDGDESNNDRNFHHRGSIYKVNADGTKVFASARDAGNYAAGYIAASKGLSWFGARSGFDGLEIIKSAVKGHFVSGEGRQSTMAQFLGYKDGLKKLFPKKELFKEDK